jgi:hypothetical protein
MEPVYPADVNLYNDDGIYLIEQNGVKVARSVKEHFRLDSQASALLKTLQSTAGDDFVAACNDIRDELQTRLRFGQSDLVENLFYILQHTHWYDRPAYHNSGCTTFAELDEMKALGLPVDSGGVSREVSLGLVNMLLEKMGLQLKSGSDQSRVDFFSQYLAKNVDINDPAQIAIAATDRAAAITQLAASKVTSFGCFNTPKSQPPVTRTALLVSGDGKRRAAFTVDVDQISTSTQVTDLRVTSIFVSPLLPSDPEARALVGRISSSSPSDACITLLGAYFADFSAMPVKNPNTAAVLLRILNDRRLASR